jgi:hypothetical protein
MFRNSSRSPHDLLSRRIWYVIQVSVHRVYKVGSKKGTLPGSPGRERTKPRWCSNSHFTADGDVDDAVGEWRPGHKVSPDIEILSLNTYGIVLLQFRSQYMWSMTYCYYLVLLLLYRKYSSRSTTMPSTPFCPPSTTMLMHRFASRAIVIAVLLLRTCTFWTDSFVMKPVIASRGSCQTSSKHPKLQQQEQQQQQYCTTRPHGVAVQVGQQPQHEMTQSSGDGTMQIQTPKKAIYSFTDARRMARNYQFNTKDEFLDYACPGAYQLPKNPDQVWPTEWRGWEDWLGVRLDFEIARQIARTLKLNNKTEYMELISSNTIHDNDDASRLPYQPDKIYTKEWISWDDWLGINVELEVDH